jgi:RNA polymerase sporulation-specific sigma factor
MDYKEINDNELIYMCCENNEEAENIIIDKYKNCINQCIKNLMKEYYIVGMEASDLYQEGLIGLMHAIKSFNEERDVTFYTYANTCIKTSIISAMRYTFRKKNRILNTSYSLDKIMGEETNHNFYEIFKDNTNEPTGLIIKEEENKELIEMVRSKLSKKELQVFNYKLEGLTNDEIAHSLNSTKKFVENTVFRINKKYKELFK